MRIAQPSTVLAYLPLYIAIEESEHELVSFDRADLAIDAVCKGHAELAVGDPFLFNYLNYSEKQIVIVGGLIENVLHSVITFNPFVTKADSAQLSKKTVACYPEPSTSFFLAEQLQKQFKLTRVLQTPFNTELGPLITLEADVAIVLEPNTTYALRNGARELVDFSNQIAAFTGFLTTRKHLEQNQNEMQELLQSVLNGIRVFLTERERTLEIARKFFPLVEEKVLIDSIQRLRVRTPYCPGLLFSAEAIREGLKLRNVSFTPKQIEKFLVHLPLQPVSFAGSATEKQIEHTSKSKHPVIPPG